MFGIICDETVLKNVSMFGKGEPKVPANEGAGGIGEATADLGTLYSCNSNAVGQHSLSVSVSRLRTTCSRCKYDSCCFVRPSSCFPFVSQEIESETAKLSLSSRPSSLAFLIPNPVMSNCVRFRARFRNLAVVTGGFGVASSFFALFS